jgi:hypothetical protein
MRGRACKGEMMPTSNSERKPSCLIPIVVAVIGALATIAAALISSGSLGGLFVSAAQPPTDLPRSSVSPVSTDASKGFRVVEVFLRADPFDFDGSCPITITFSGRISVAGGGGTVSYKWLRNDGASAPVETVTFEGPGSKDISTSWQLGGPGLPSYDGWQALQIFDPQPRTSERATFRIRCQ